MLMLLLSIRRHFRRRRRYVLRLSVRCPSVNGYFAWRIIFLLSARVSM